MVRTTLTWLAMPHITEDYEHQSVCAARKRRLQMMPGYSAPTAPGEEMVSHYQGPKEEVLLGPEPMSLVARPDEQKPRLFK